MKRRKEQRGEKGFTLVELLVVMSILAVLAALVLPTVTGMKTGGETAAGKSDAKELETAISMFNASSRTQTFPESPIGCVDSGNIFTMAITNTAFATNMPKSVKGSKNITGDTESGVQIKSPVAESIGLVSFGVSTCSSTVITSHTLVNFDANTTVRQADGTVKTLNLIPDFLLSTPKSAIWVRGSTPASDPDEYIWLLKKGTESDTQGRTLQVLRLNQATPAQYEIARY